MAMSNEFGRPSGTDLDPLEAEVIEAGRAGWEAGRGGWEAGRAGWEVLGPSPVFCLLEAESVD